MTLRIDRFDVGAAYLGATRGLRNGRDIVRIVLLASEISVDHGGRD